MDDVAAEAVVVEVGDVLPVVAVQVVPHCFPCKDHARFV